MDFEELRHHAHRQVDWMVDYLSTLESRPVRSQIRAGSILSQLAPSCPSQGEPMERIFADFEHILMPGITHWQHPRFFAYFPANSSPPSVLAEMLTATLASQCMLWETSPAATELEMRVMQWLRELLDLPEVFTGSIQDSASAATLCALIAARDRATAGQAARAGIAGAQLTVYASADAHSSVEKAVRILGIGSNHLRKIPVDAEGGMDPGALEASITADRGRGLIPACVVACLGTTGIGANDPLEPIGQITAREDLHLHVDAAWAGSALILPEVRSRLRGLSVVDSFVFNPHKWLFTNFDCSAFFMRDPQRLVNALTLTPAYLESSLGGNTPEYRDWSVALGRRFRALKLWFVMRSYGAEGLRALLRNHIAWTERLSGLITGDDRFELVAGPNLAMLAFRLKGGAMHSDAQVDALNERLLERLNGAGRIYLTRTRHRGRTVIRFVIGQTYTQWHHVEQGWDEIRKAAKELMAQSLREAETPY